MKKILVVCPYPFNKAPSQRLKYEQYFPSWREHGYDITVSSFMNERFWKIAYERGRVLSKFFFVLAAYFRRWTLLFRLRQYDLVYVHLWVTPFGPPVFEWLVCKLSKRIVYDIDDLVYLKNTKGSKWYINLVKGRKKPVYLMKHASQVITCTPYLDEFVRKYNDRTTDISSTIDTDAYQPVNAYTNDHKLVLGWSGSHSTTRYLRLLHPVLLELKKKVDFQLLMMGDENFKLEGIDVVARKWTAKSEISVLQQMDIGLYPLPLDEEWVYGKSGLKALQYMALGIPTIATAIGTNFRIINDGVNGFLVASEIEWTQRLLQLINDAELRRRIGRKGRENVEQHYSIRANAGTYLSILNKVLTEVNNK